MLFTKRIYSVLKRLVPDSRGVAAVELALCLPVIAGLIIPLTDLGMGAYTKMQLIDAAQAGAEYAARTAAKGFSAANVSGAVTNATTLSGVTALPAPTQQCGCINGATITFTTGNPPCTQTCASGGPGTFVTVSAQANFKPLFPYPMIPTDASGNVTLSATSVIRIN